MSSSLTQAELAKIQASLELTLTPTIAVPPPITEIMFPGTRLVYEAGSSSVVVIEESPRVRTVELRPGIHGARFVDNSGFYHLAFPHLVTFIETSRRGNMHYFNRMRIFARPG